MYHCFKISCSHSLFTSEDENSSSCEGEVQTKPEQKVLQCNERVYKAGFMARPSIHCLSQCKGESWRLHVVVSTHPCYSVCGEIKEHISLRVYTLVGSKDVYIWLPSLVNAYNVLCMLCQSHQWEVQHRLRSEHDKIFFNGLITSCSAVL